MILKKDFRETDIEITGEQSDSIEMGIDTDSISSLMMILSSNLYQDSIGSIIREYTSNAIDANVDAKCDEPVIVSLKQINSNWLFEVQDYGLGLDDKDFRTIISKYGKSTKRNKEDQLGFYGLGTKSAFSYTNQFNFTCVKEGVQRKYLVYKNDVGFKIDLLFEQKTEERSGVKVSIPVKYNDSNNFYVGIKKQLAYFDNVYFDIDYKKLAYHYNSDNLNNMQIYTEQDFQYSTLYTENSMHITLGRVNYPINWSILGYSELRIPVALKFDLNSGLFPVPNRENLIWNDTTKSLVKDKIAQVCEWMVNSYNSKIGVMNNIIEAWDHINVSERRITYGDKTFNITDTSKYSKNSFKEVTIPHIKLRNPHFYKSKFASIVRNYKVVADIKNSYTLRTKGCYTGMSQLLDDKKVLLLSNDSVIIGYFREYLKSLDYKLFLREKTELESPKEDLAFYKQELWLSNISKDKWRAYINEFLEVRKECFKVLWKDGTDLHVSKEFEDFKKLNKRVSTGKTKAGLNKQSHHVTIAYYTGRGFSKGVKVLEDLRKLPHLSVMLDDNEKLDIDKLSLLYKGIQFCVIGVKDRKRIDNNKPHNFMTLKELEKTKFYSRVATALYANKVISDYEKLVSNRLDTVAFTMTKFRDLYQKVRNYRDKYTIYKIYSIDDKFVSSILTNAETYNLWDKSFIHEIKTLDKNIKDYNFIPYLKELTYRSTEEEKEEMNRLINNLILFQKLRFEERFSNLEICVRPDKVEEIDLVQQQMENLV